MKTTTSILIALLFICNYSFAQSSGNIKGNVSNPNDEPVAFAPVALMEGNAIIKSAQTDDKGYFSFIDIVPGKYNLQISYTGFNTSLLKDILVDPSKSPYLTITLSPNITDLPPVVVSTTWENSIIDRAYSTMTPINIEQIEQTAAPKGDIIAIAVALTPAVMPTNDGKDLIMRGTRRGASAYYVDGNKTMEAPSVPGLGIASMEILTGGIPAEYGDVTGGVIIITTKDYKWEMSRNRIKQQAKEETE